MLLSHEQWKLENTVLLFATVTVNHIKIFENLQTQKYRDLLLPYRIIAVHRLRHIKVIPEWYFIRKKYCSFEKGYDRKRSVETDSIQYNLLLQFFLVTFTSFLLLFHPLLCPPQSLYVLLYIYLFQYTPKTHILKSWECQVQDTVRKTFWKYNGQKESQASCPHGAYILLGKVDIKYIIIHINIYSYNNCYDGKYRLLIII